MLFAGCTATGNFRYSCYGVMGGFNHLILGTHGEWQCSIAKSAGCLTVCERVVCRLAAMLLASCSVAVMVAEATISPKLPNLSVFSWALHRTARTELGTELLCFLLLAYPTACAYFAIYKLGRFKFFLLVPG